MTGSLLEPLVEQCFFELLARRRRARATAPASPRPSGRSREAEAALERYRDNDRVARALGPERYADGLARRARSSSGAAGAGRGAARAATPTRSGPRRRSSGAGRR